LELFVSMSLPGGVELRVGLGPEGMIGSEVRVEREFLGYVADISPRLAVLLVTWSNKNDVAGIAEDDSLFVLLVCVSDMSGAGTMMYHYKYINVSLPFFAKERDLAVSPIEWTIANSTTNRVQSQNVSNSINLLRHLSWIRQNFDL